MVDFTLLVRIISTMSCLVEPLYVHMWFWPSEGPGLTAGNLAKKPHEYADIACVFSWPCMVDSNRLWMDCQRHCGYSEYMIHSWEQTSHESLLHNDIGEMHISLILQCTWTRSARPETLRQQRLIYWMCERHIMADSFESEASYLNNL